MGYPGISTTLAVTLFLSATASHGDSLGPTVTGAGFEQLVGVPGESIELVVELRNDGDVATEAGGVQACSQRHWCGESQVDGLEPGRSAVVRVTLDVDYRHLNENPHYFFVWMGGADHPAQLEALGRTYELSKPLFVVEPKRVRRQPPEEHDNFIEIRNGLAVTHGSKRYGETGATSEVGDLDDPEKRRESRRAKRSRKYRRVDPLVKAGNRKAKRNDLQRYLIRYSHDVPMPSLPPLDDSSQRFSDRNTTLLEERLAILEGVRRARIAELGRLSESFLELGVTVLEDYCVADCLLVEAPRGVFRSLLGLNQIVHIEPEISGEHPPQFTTAGDTVLDGRTRIGTDPYYDSGATGSSYLALLDTGIRRTHELLAHPTHIGFAEDCVNGDWNCNDIGGGYDPTDCTNGGHGTAAAAILTGNSNLGPAYRGVTAGLLDSWRVYDCSLVRRAVLRAYDQAVAWGGQIIVAEIQAKGEETGCIASAADNAYDAGSITIAANGNSGHWGKRTVRTPASAHKALGVGAYNVSDLAPGKHSRGPTKDNRIKPDLLAPTGTRTASNANDQGLASFWRTSGATPYAAGAAAILLDWYRRAGMSAASPGKIYAGLINAGPLGWRDFDNDSRGVGRFLLPLNGRIWTGSRNNSQHESDDVLFSVPDGADQIRAAIWWPEGTFMHNDVDLYLLDPDGTVVRSSISVPSVFEHVVVQRPSAGKWTLRIYGYDVSRQEVFYNIFVGVGSK